MFSKEHDKKVKSGGVKFALRKYFSPKCTALSLNESKNGIKRENTINTARQRCDVSLKNAVFKF